MFILGTSIMFFPMFGPCIRRIQPTFLAVSASPQLLVDGPLVRGVPEIMHVYALGS